MTSTLEYSQLGENEKSFTFKNAEFHVFDSKGKYVYTGQVKKNLIH